MIIILGATLTTFEQFVFTSNRNQEHNDSATAARNTLDLLARQLRNHVAAAPDQQLGIDKATPYDIVFQTVDQPKPAGSANLRNVRRGRYCPDPRGPTTQEGDTTPSRGNTAA